ncbi:hypothetical protein V2O64_12300 [Verrucomicrobiaceae bacterium 227]
MNTFVAAAALLFAAPAVADNHEGDVKGMIHHTVTASHVSGSALWDFKGNKLGNLEEVIIMPGSGKTMVVLDTSILDDDRKVVLPFNMIVVKTKADDADEIFYALDADKDKLLAAPEYSGDSKLMKKDVMGSCKYWDKNHMKRAKEKLKDAANKTGDAVDEVVEEVKDAVKE